MRKESTEAIKDVALFDFRQGMRNYKRVLIGTVAALFLAGFLGYGFKGLFDSGLVLDPFTIGIVNFEHSEYIDFIFEQIQEDSELSKYVTFVFFGESDSAKKAVQDETVMAAIIIPGKFLDNLLSGHQSGLEIYANESKPVQTLMMTGIINSYFKMFVAANYTMQSATRYYRQNSASAKELDRKTMFFILDSMNTMKQVRQSLVQEVSLRDVDTAGMAKYLRKLEDNTGIKGKAILIASVVEYYFVVVILLFVLFISVAQAGAMISERDSGLAERIIVAGVGRNSYLAGKFFGGFFLTFGQSSILLVCAALFFYQTNPRALPMIMLVLFATVFMVNAFSFLLALIFNNLERFTVVGNLLVFLMAAVGGGLIPILYLPDHVYYLAWLTPHYWGIDGVVSAIGGNYKQAFFDVGLLFVYSFILAMAAILVSLRRWRHDI
jgi:ABC-type multidrug transport system permease subunit